MCTNLCTQNAQWGTLRSHTNDPSRSLILKYISKWSHKKSAQTNKSKCLIQSLVFYNSKL